MVSVEQAQRLVLEHARRLPAKPVALGSDCLGAVLAEDVVSDLDMPPFDKALMDGYAVRCADFLGGGEVFAVAEEIPAGHTPQLALGAGQAARIMTGAEVPSGADAVVMVERTELIQPNLVRILEQPSQAGQNILRRGREMRRGDIVLRGGTVLRPQELGLLATVGASKVKTYRQPTVALVSTGDEVVEPTSVPGHGQIRNSNAPMLAAQAARAGAAPRYLGIARDTADSLRAAIADGLDADFLLLSGGVSAGKFDLVPGVLKGFGVESVFHQVAMKPGKPLFFGVREATLVFGLPGNPVSSLVGFELFVRPALRIAAGRADAGPIMVTAQMANDYSHRSDRPTYHPAQLKLCQDGWHITPIPWFGSADLRAISQANAFAVFEPGERHYRQGEAVRVLAPELQM